MHYQILLVNIRSKRISSTNVQRFHIKALQVDFALQKVPCLPVYCGCHQDVNVNVLVYLLLNELSQSSYYLTGCKLEINW